MRNSKLREMIENTIQEEMENFIVEATVQDLKASLQNLLKTWRALAKKSTGKEDFVLDQAASELAKLLKDAVQKTWKNLQNGEYAEIEKNRTSSTGDVATGLMEGDKNEN